MLNQMFGILWKEISMWMMVWFHGKMWTLLSVWSSVLKTNYSQEVNLDFIKWRLITNEFCKFPSDDLANNLKDLSFDTDDLPIQRSLGVTWNIESDCFTFQVNRDSKPFTKRGVLSTINGLFDRAECFTRETDATWNYDMPRTHSKGRSFTRGLPSVLGTLGKQFTFLGTM